MLHLVAAALLAQSLTVDGDLTVLAPYYAYLPYARVSVIKGWNQGGVSVQTSRVTNDPNADLDIWHQNRTAGQAWRASKGTGQVVGQLEWDGTLWAGGGGTGRAFVSMGGAYTCQPGTGGCYTAIYGGMLNKSHHGAVVLGNEQGNPDRDGGLALQVVAKGRPSTYANTVLAVDVMGNTRAGGLIGNYLPSSEFDPCSVTPGFDNPTPALDSPGGLYRPRGMWGYDYQLDAMRLCTARSAADAGYEKVCTDQNGACLPNDLTFTSNNDAIYITKHFPDGGTRTVTLSYD